MSKNEDLIVWGSQGSQLLLGARCSGCGGRGRLFESPVDHDSCQPCGGLGWFGIDPNQPVTASAGSVAKIATLTVRYASGLPLFNARDWSDSEDRLFAHEAGGSQQAPALDGNVVLPDDDRQEELFEQLPEAAQLAL